VRSQTPRISTSPEVFDVPLESMAERRKSNWALPVERPPFTAFPITCGITFTFGGVRVDEDARVLDVSGRPLRGLLASGELVGGLFFHNYPGGTGLTAGAVYGRRAGYAAAAGS
jgi:tricarballylate dehydrogenase